MLPDNIPYNSRFANRQSPILQSAIALPQTKKHIQVRAEKKTQDTMHTLPWLNQRDRIKPYTNNSTRIHSSLQKRKKREREREGEVK